MACTERSRSVNSEDLLSKTSLKSNWWAMPTLLLEPPNSQLPTHSCSIAKAFTAAAAIALPPRRP